ncbi:MAG: hypothetical protein IT443_12995 [Phycisphaeraceae bacterium]|nr:hypothetical protein [Phycisphaeraceae bacterium]
MRDSQGILFTAFEPSGDTIAAAVIAELKHRWPDRPIWALGGEKMAAAGAELIEHTTSHPVMFAQVLGQVWQHQQRLKRLKRWLKDHPVGALVPVDSPAANWSVCQIIRKQQPGAKVVHLVAPQLWAWGAWRIRKLRRLTDRVLCLMPFEVQWFQKRGVPAVFVGHPILDWAKAAGPLTAEERQARAERNIQAQPRLALLPGSRAAEIKANWPTMLAAYGQLRARWPGLSGQVAAIHAQAADQLRAITEKSRKKQGADAWPAGLEMIVSRLDAVLEDCDLALVVSGTATLDVVRHRRPMVVLYNANWLAWQAVGRWLLTTRTFTLPNLISEWQGSGRAVAELVPHFGQVGPVTEELARLIAEPGRRKDQVRALEAVAKPFEGQRFAVTAAEEIGRMAGDLELLTT